MYEDFFGFREPPFTLHPDPDFLYLTAAHSDALAHLEFAVQERKGIVAVVGDVGSGKTTLINTLLRRLPSSLEVGVVGDTALPPDAFLRVVCDDLGLPVSGLDPVELLGVLRRHVLEQYGQGKRVLLIVDEAQNLPLETLERLRMLSNLETEKDYLLQILLVGQPQLGEKLARKDMEQLYQRVSASFHLGPLKESDVGPYIRHRLRVAGSSDLDIFEEGATVAIASHARCIPRLINVLCDATLISAYADGKKRVGAKDVEGAVETRKSLGLGGRLETLLRKSRPARRSSGGSATWSTGSTKARRGSRSSDSASTPPSAASACSSTSSRRPCVRWIEG